MKSGFIPFPRQSFWKEDNSISKHIYQPRETKTSRYDCQIPLLRIVNSQRYPIFWTEFENILEPQEDTAICRIIKPEEKNTVTDSVPDICLPRKEEKGFPIYTRKYSPIDYQLGFKFIDPMDFYTFNDLLLSLQISNARSIVIDDPRDGFMFDTEDPNSKKGK